MFWIDCCFYHWLWNWSRHQHGFYQRGKRESGKLNKQCLTLVEKINILSCRVIAKEFKIGKTQAANVLKNERTLREEFANFQGKGFKNINRRSHQKFKAINDILYSWFKKCEASGIYLNGLLLKEEAINIKQSLNRQKLDGFKASEGWLDKCTLSHGIKEKQISGESLDVSKTTVESWMERIKELYKGYDHKDILISDAFLKLSSLKVLLRRERKARVEKSLSRGSQLHFSSVQMEKKLVSQLVKHLCWSNLQIH